MSKRVIAEGSGWALVCYGRSIWCDTDTGYGDFSVVDVHYMPIWHLTSHVTHVTSGKELKFHVLARYLQCPSEEEEVKRRIEILLRLAGIDV